jgi:hypothetical protein
MFFCVPIKRGVKEHGGKNFSAHEGEIWDLHIFRKKDENWSLYGRVGKRDKDALTRRGFVKVSSTSQRTSVFLYLRSLSGTICGAGNWDGILTAVNGKREKR